MEDIDKEKYKVELTVQELDSHNWQYCERHCELVLQGLTNAYR